MNEGWEALKQFRNITTSKNNQVIMKLENVLLDLQTQLNVVKQDLRLVEGNFQINTQFVREELNRFRERIDSIEQQKNEDTTTKINDIDVYIRNQISFLAPSPKELISTETQVDTIPSIGTVMVDSSEVQDLKFSLSNLAVKFDEMNRTIQSRRDFRINDRQLVQMVINAMMNDRDFIMFLIQKSKEVSQEITDFKMSSLQGIFENKMSIQQKYIDGVQLRVRELTQIFSDYQERQSQNQSEIYDQMSKTNAKLEQLHKITNNIYGDFHQPFQKVQDDLIELFSSRTDQDQMRRKLEGDFKTTMIHVNTKIKEIVPQKYIDDEIKKLIQLIKTQKQDLDEAQMMMNQKVTNLIKQFNEVRTSRQTRNSESQSPSRMSVRGSSKFIDLMNKIKDNSRLTFFQVPEDSGFVDEHIVKRPQTSVQRRVKPKLTLPLENKQEPLATDNAPKILLRAKKASGEVSNKPRLVTPQPQRSNFESNCILIDNFNYKL